MNTKSREKQEILRKIILKTQLSEEEVDKILLLENSTGYELTNDLNKIIGKYHDNPQKLARIIEKRCKRESLNNTRKRRNIKRKHMLKCLNHENINFREEKRICLILDNYSVHRSAFIQEIAEKLNIVLIYLPPYSPRLNPIEQLWRIIKANMKKHYLKTQEYMKKLVVERFNKECNNIKLFEKWFNNFIIN